MSFLHFFFFSNLFNQNDEELPFDRVEDCVGKAENDAYRRLFFLSHCFQNYFRPWNSFVKGKIKPSNSLPFFPLKYQIHQQILTY